MEVKEAGRGTAFGASNRAMRNHPVSMNYRATKELYESDPNKLNELTFETAKDEYNAFGHRLEDHYLEIYATARADGLDPKAAHQKAEASVKQLADSLR